MIGWSFLIFKGWKHDKMNNFFTLVVYFKNKLKITTKSIIKLLYIEFFYLNDQIQFFSLLLCIRFQNYHCKYKFSVGFLKY